MNKFISLAKNISNAISSIDDIKAVAIYGSVALGFQDKDSDIDMVVFCDRIPSIKTREDELKKLKEIEFVQDNQDKKKMDYVDYNGMDISIFYKVTKKCENLIKGYKNNDVYWPEISDIIAELFFGKVLYDPEKVFERLKKQIPVPDINGYGSWSLDYLNRTIYDKKGFMGNRLKSAINRKNNIAINCEFAWLINNAIVCIYALNGLYYTTPKWAPNYLKKMKIKPIGYEKRINTLAILGNDADSIRTKIKILKTLVDDINYIKNQNK